MKNSLIAIAFLLTMNLFSQTKNNKFGVTAGGGTQHYMGDLGHFNNETSYGGFIFQGNYFLNKNFDAGMFSSIGDFGYCQTEKEKNTEVAAQYRCPGCNRVGLGNLSSRLYSAGGMIKYKFNNGYLLKENSAIRPYVYAGAAVNHLQDIMKMNCVSVGNYGTLNAGAGFKYYVSERLNLGYNISTGYFLNDNVDFMNHGKGSDLYLQNTVTIGFDLF
jgi:hypothetical protein